MASLLAKIRKDGLTRRLAPALCFDVDPRSISDYGLPAYKDYQFRREPRLIRRLRKLAALAQRRRLVQERDYIRLGAFRETETFRFLEQLWAADLDWKRTDRYRDFLARVGAGEEVRLHSKRKRMASAADLDEYFRDYALLLESMRDRGYVATGSRDRITVMVGRHGDILKETKGRHRLAAAQVVGAPSVPVRVSHVHAAWVEAQAGVDGAPTGRDGLVLFAIAKALARVSPSPVASPASRVLTSLLQPDPAATPR